MSDAETMTTGIYARCCRLCLTDISDHLKSVFDDCDSDKALKERILANLSVDIQADDKLSTMVCDPCVTKINEWCDFKNLCEQNQATLKDWASKILDMSVSNIRVKEEIVDHDNDIEIVDANIKVKTEPPDENCIQNGDDTPFLENAYKCRGCNEEFDGELKLSDHEKTHEMPTEGQVEVPLRNSTEEKIEFAAGLRLIQSNSTPINMESLSKMELSYMEKCKAMVQMSRTLVCACHGVLYPNLKGMLSHLRSLKIWFPVFTCYHCMITFTDRSTNGRHIHKCQKKNLETLVQLSNLKKRSAVKTRLYQNYRCVECRFTFSFHEDFCKHIDEEHSDSEPPYDCSCGQRFDSLENYKDHVYVSCMVEYYCDICHASTNSLSEFIAHAENEHDQSEGFTLVQDDNYKRRVSVKTEIAQPREDKAILGKRRSSTFGSAVTKTEPVDLYEEEEESYEDEPAAKRRNAKFCASECPECGKVYSNYTNMLRHYKVHEKGEERRDDPKDDSLYRCPDCQVMYNAQDWELHKESHGQKKCSECDKIFLFQSELDQHRSVHLNLKLYRDAKTDSYKSTMISTNSETPVCDICNILCESFEDLESHKLSHEDLDVNDTETNNESAAKYSCIPCNKHYTGYSGLWEHNKKKHSDKQTNAGSTYPRQCDECDKILTGGSAYASHKQMHRRMRAEAEKARTDSPISRSRSRRSNANPDDDEDYFTCKRCFKVFTTKYNLKTHMKLHGINLMHSSSKNSNKKLACTPCDLIFNNSDDFHMHNEEEHEDDMPDLVSVIDEFNNKPYVFTCDICVQTFTTKEALKQHKETHIVEMKPAAYCKYCKIPFATLASLDEHMVIEHDEIPKPSKSVAKIHKPSYACKICRKTFVSQPAMYAHQGWHKRSMSMASAASSPQTFVAKKPAKSGLVCPTCNLELPNETAKQVHILEKHRDVSALLRMKCEPCNIEFTTQTEYENHKKLHEIVEGQKKTGHSCQYCPASFNKAETLAIHVNLNHREHGQEFKCQLCGRVFDKQASLTNHMKVHEKQKIVVGSPKQLYFCSICNMGFNLPKDLRNHTISAHPF